ncbi:GTPase ObgE [mine drainage metagenome]|uniref:GTPase ObgE n=1 Tax=mine drainage metagenome TaxID=410659 RepID=T1D3H1_9ZZZZ
MKFVDEAVIHVLAGNGGNGCVSFRREKFVPRGGPDGGDGGRGGSIYLVGVSGLNTLVDFRVRTFWRARSGLNGSGRNRTGASGTDLLIPVPLGTLVYNQAHDEMIGEVTRPDERLLVARGGDGGLGNTHFKSSVRQAPRKATPGAPGEERMLHLELRVLADVGLLGLPNAGKSSLLAKISDARPKVGDYPFTTLTPKLGKVQVGLEQSFFVADIPGLIEGAAAGRGLGIQFLKHLSRTRLLFHIVDLSRGGAESLARDIAEIEGELLKYDPELTRRPIWLVLNKMDLIDRSQVAALKGAVASLDPHPVARPHFLISARDGTGLTELLKAAAAELESQSAKLAAKSKPSPPAGPEASEIPPL